MSHETQDRSARRTPKTERVPALGVILGGDREYRLLTDRLGGDGGCAEALGDQPTVDVETRRPSTLVWIDSREALPSRG